MLHGRRKDAQPFLQRSIKPERTLCIGFLAIILVGSILLSLPFATQSGESIGLGRGLFTATSAVCVTGLVVVDTGTTFNLFGQLVLLTLIQLGGLGFMIFATLTMVVLGKRITLHDRLLIRESMNTTTYSGLIRLTRWYGLLALVIEGGGALLLAIRFVPLLGPVRGFYYSVWHSVSAFCNAGFDLFGNYSSLTSFTREPLVLMTVSVLIVLGGTGFAVISEVISGNFRWRNFSLHAKLVLLMTGLLLLLGTVYIAVAEWSNPATLGAVDGAGHRISNAFFQSVTLRTAGFNSIDMAAMKDGTKLVSILLMFVGANSASTGGGVKTTTIAVLMMAVWSVIRGREDMTVLGRRLPRSLVHRALAVVTVTMLAFLLATLVLAVAEDGRVPFIDLMFETASAMATVGVSSAGTPALTLGSKIALIPLMYLGRVGPLTLAMALANRQDARGSHVRFPEETVTIG